MEEWNSSSITDGRIFILIHYIITFHIYLYSIILCYHVMHLLVLYIFLYYLPVTIVLSITVMFHTSPSFIYVYMRTLFLVEIMVFLPTLLFPSINSGKQSTLKMVKEKHTSYTDNKLCLKVGREVENTC